MKTKSLLFVGWFLFACAGPRRPADKDALFHQVVSDLPDYPDFLTVDELHRSLEMLREEYPELVSLNLVGETETATPIYEFRLGAGENHALLFGFPHPNEPIGSMMLHYLTSALVKNAALRDYFDFTWHIVICADPDGAKLNEGWFQGDLTLTKYARNFYRPPARQQVEWTFPVSYKDYRFNSPTPATRALMTIIDSHPIHFSFSLHNSGFGGAYYYWSHDVAELYPVLYQFIRTQGIPLHLGEPEVPYGKKLDDRAMFKFISFADGYDYMEKYSPVPPEQLLNSGGSSNDYIGAKHKALSVVCELPYFYDARIEDTSPSDMTRREANLRGIENRREILHFLEQTYEKVQPRLTARSPFVDAIEELLRTGESNLETDKRGIEAEKEFERTATVAEKWDALYVGKFYNLLSLGQFVRLLEHEKARTGPAFPAELEEALNVALSMFEAKSAEVETELDYTVVPIKKLASVQLLTALHGMDYVQRHTEPSIHP